jgi:hypothetical protein
MKGPNLYLDNQYINNKESWTISANYRAYQILIKITDFLFCKSEQTNTFAANHTKKKGESRKP